MTDGAVACWCSLIVLEDYVEKRERVLGGEMGFR